MIESDRRSAQPIKLQPKPTGNSKVSSFGFALGILAGGIAALLYTTPVGKKVRLQLEEDGADLLEGINQADFHKVSNNGLIRIIKQAYRWLLAYSKSIE